MRQIEIREMKPDEAEETGKVALSAFKSIENEGFSDEGKAAFINYASAIASRLALEHQVFVASDSGRIVGMLELRHGEHISMLFVLPEMERKGIGTKLLSFVVTHLRECRFKKPLTVHAAEAAVSFYVKRNFRASGSRQENHGIKYSTLAFSIKGGDVIDSKLRDENVEFFVFSGTGNTYHVAGKIAELLNEKGISVNLYKMEKHMKPELPDESAIGIAFPVACFSSYPTVLNFLDSLPEGNGRKAFMVGTMGGLGMGMEGPFKRLMLEKGYSPIASKLFVMPGNYGNKQMPSERNATRIEGADASIPGFVESLMLGTESWKGSWPGISELMYRLARSRRPWNLFYRMFPIQVNEKKCTICGRCVRLCPSGALKIRETEEKQKQQKFPYIDKKICQSCQRCVGFCPQCAIEVPNKPAVQYSFMSYDEFKNFGS